MRKVVGGVIHCVASCCNPLRKVELSSTSCNASRNRKNCKTTHVTLCNSPATCLAMTKLLKKLCNVTEPLELVCLLFAIHCVSVCEASTVGKISDCQPEGPRFNSRPDRGLNFVVTLDVLWMTYKSPRASRENGV